MHRILRRLHSQHDFVPFRTFLRFARWLGSGEMSLWIGVAVGNFTTDGFFLVCIFNQFQYGLF
jgi:hypothetical protein